ncbi:hypothetical protein E2C01_047062 [Portunus trituberculatus]|uniref:Uncharacterized protein n=1 Tax=Portunus trituberculatus TaxID=210409 RepID=A0A5B7G6X5_PORTR|nr:hypothetical protein [Portunus trituberculatus]
MLSEWPGTVKIKVTISIHLYLTDLKSSSLVTILHELWIVTILEDRGRRTIPSDRPGRFFFLADSSSTTDSPTET